MIFAVDVGNTNIVIGGLDEEKPVFSERIATDSSKTDCEYAVIIKNIFEICNVRLEDIEGAILSCVVPPLTAVIVSAIKKVAKVDCLIVNSKMNMSGLSIAIDNPEGLGSDLIADAAAAVDAYDLPLAVVEIGTATTVSVIDEEKRYLGGIICPGLKLSLETLSSKAAQLPAIGLTAPGKIIAANTADCMRSGILYGHAAMIDGCIDRMEAELGKTLTVVVTGGLAPCTAGLCRHKVVTDECLLLKGLGILYKNNVPQ